MHLSALFAHKLYPGLTHSHVVSHQLCDMQQALTFVPGDDPELVDMFKRWSIAYSKVLMCHLREEGDVESELQVSHSPICCMQFLMCCCCLSAMLDHMYSAVG